MEVRVRHGWSGRGWRETAAHLLVLALGSALGSVWQLGSLDGETALGVQERLRGEAKPPWKVGGGEGDGSRAGQGQPYPTVQIRRPGSPHVERHRKCRSLVECGPGETWPGPGAPHHAQPPAGGPVARDSAAAP